MSTIRILSRYVFYCQITHPIKAGEGPIVLVLAPTRELVMQIEA